MQQVFLDFDKDDKQVLSSPMNLAPITLVKGYLSLAQQETLIAEAVSYPFSRPSIQVYGQSHIIPRSQVWFADQGCDYLYSGLLIQALPWPKYSLCLRDKLQREFQLNYQLIAILMDNSRWVGTVMMSLKL